MSKNLPEAKSAPEESKQIDPRENKLIRNLYLYPNNINKAALTAGYSETYSRTAIYKHLKKPRVQEKIKQYAIDNDFLQLPKVVYINNKILDHLVETPLDEPKHRHTLRDIQVKTGLLRDDVGPRTQTININTIERAQVVMSDVITKRLEDQTPDGQRDPDVEST